MGRDRGAIADPENTQKAGAGGPYCLLSGN